jgi:D-alanyl-D-alanine carboxypeptidase (penicillin-binding protein 5/6)
MGLPSRMALVGALVIGANPVLLAMSASVQNDTLSLLLAFIAMLICVEGWPALSARRAFVAGILCGAAILAKLTAWPVALVVVVALLIRRRRAMAAFLLGCVPVAGWWLLWNQATYGSLTPRNALLAANFKFPAYHLTSLHGVGFVLEEVVTYLWLPTEYFRNIFHTPVELKAFVVVMTVAVAICGGWHLARRRLQGRELLLGTAAVAVLAWFYTFVRVQALAFRTAYVALPAWCLLVALSGSRLRRAALPVLGVVMLALNAWVLARLAILPAHDWGVVGVS